MSRHAESLAARGFQSLVSTVVDSVGIVRAKQVPVARADVHAGAGLGVSPVWAVFCVDDSIAFTPGFGVIGDWRMRADLDAVADLGDGLAWAPAELFDQHGEPLPICSRGALRRQQSAAEQAGLELLCAIEIECTMFDETGTRLGGADPVNGPAGPAYGLRPLLAHQSFLADLTTDLERAGLQVEALHAEYGPGQLELSLAPARPLRAVDDNVLARLVMARAARRHGVQLSFSPMPVAGGAGCGAHLHLSATADGQPLLSGGDGPHGLTPRGASMIAGVLNGLESAMGVFAGSAMSELRLVPHMWSGAFACWGVENREAALRLLTATPGNVYGANLEVKVIDPSANPYVAAAAVIGLALWGLEQQLALPAETPSDPGAMSEDERATLGIRGLSVGLAATLDRLASSEQLPSILGRDIVAAILATRRHEVDLLAASTPAELAERLRFTWTS
ncbi:MAG TPA: glutamine synthetase [Mycobacteriales bacterium]|nr:glutamine synthetase [Mycobacteriales bacterium]